MHLGIGRKLVALLFLASAGALALAMLALHVLSSNLREDTLQRRFGSAFQGLHLHFDEIERRLESGAAVIASQDALLASTSLLSDPARPEANSPITFDAEKRKIAELLCNHLLSSNLDQGFVRDAAGNLFAFCRRDDHGTKWGIVSHAEGRPRILQQGGDGGVAQADPESTDIALVDARDRPAIAYGHNGNQVWVMASLPLRHSLGKPRGIAGRVVLRKRIDAHFLKPFEEASRSGLGTAILAPGQTPLPGLHAGEQRQDNKALPVDRDDEHYFSMRGLPLDDGGQLGLTLRLPRKEIDADLEHLRMVMLLTLALCALTAITLASYFSQRWIGIPLAGLAAGARRLKDGNYSSPLPAEGGDEFAAVASAFNDMADTLRRREAELRDERDHLEDKVADRTRELVRMNHALRAQIEETNSADKAHRAASNMLQLVMDHTPYFIFWKDRESRYLGCNLNFARIAGLDDPALIVGMSDYDLPWKREESDFFIATDRRIMAANEAEHGIVEPIRNAAGEMRILETNKVPLLDANGEVIGILGAFEDITERIAAQQALVDARDAAEKANRAKSDFLSHMSHELRTPLNAVLGFAQVMESDPIDPPSERQVRSLAEIIRGGEHLLEIINELLDLSRIEAGRLEVSPEPLDLHILFEEARQFILPLAESRGIAISNDGSCEALAPRVMADPLRTRQVLLNLMSNAVKYGREHGQAVLGCERLDNGFIRIRVSDDGPGIDPDLQCRIFRPFERLGHEGSNISGTGIGLTISRALVEKMGGEIGFTGKPGAGTTFWFTLPPAPAEPD